MGVEPETDTGAGDAGRRSTRDRVGTAQRSSSLFRSRRKPTGRVWPLAVGCSVRTRHRPFRGRGLHRCRENGRLRCPAGASLWLSEVRQENAFTQQAVYLAYQTDCQRCALREQCLASGAKGDRARRVSAVRRLLPPSATVERKPIIVLGPMRWVDVAGRALRRTWTAHWRRQYVEILPLVQAQQEAKPP